MVTTFNRKDIVSFGKYLLSEVRTNLINSNYKEGDKVSREERLREVYHSDMKNWIEEQGKTMPPFVPTLPTGEELQVFINGLDKNLSEVTRSIIAENLNIFNNWVKDGMPMNAS